MSAPLYYARDGEVWRRPIETPVPGGTRIEIGFPVCVMRDAAGVASAAIVADLMNAGDRVAKADPDDDGDGDTRP